MGPGLKPGPDPSDTLHTLRLSAIFAPGVGIVLGTISNATGARMYLSDMIANGEAFPGSFVARIPRRFCRAWEGLAIQGGSCRYADFMIEEGIRRNLR
jgi:hypothetical protein